MKICIPVLLSLFFSGTLFSQSLGRNHYWIPLTDKVNNEYNLTDPSAFLSERALERRQKQNISLTEEDLPPSDLYLDSLTNMGLKIKGASRWFNAVIVETKDTLLLDSLSVLSFVKNFSRNEILFTPLSSGETLVNENEYSPENIFALNYGKSELQTSILNGKNLHDMGYKGQGIHIAVIDAGFYESDSLEAFNKLRESGRLLGYRDFVDRGSDIFNQSSHGTSVLSTMAADLPGLMVGAAPEASYWLIRSEDALTEYRIEEAWWVLAAEFADSVGVDVINSSLGYSTFYDSAMNYSHEDLDGKTALVTLAAEKAFSKGMLVVVSAGNEGNNEWQKITPPADGPNILSVGAIDTSLTIAGFSSTGPTADGRIKPDVVAVGSRTTIINSSGNPVPAYGTSFASPQVAGMAACLWQSAPEKSNLEILEAIRSTAGRYHQPDDLYGFGIPNFTMALWRLSEYQPEEEYQMILFPNPFIDRLHLGFINTGSVVKELNVFSYDGKLVYSLNGNWKQGDMVNLNVLSKLNPGLYLLVAHTENKEIIQKFIRQH